MVKDIQYSIIQVCSIFCLILFIVGTGEAVSVSSVNFSLDKDGMGTVDMQYTMNESEKLQYNLITKILNPEVIGKEQLEKAINKTVTISSVSTDSAEFTIEGLASRIDDELVIPAFSYQSIDTLLEKDLRWVAQKFDVNLIPHITSITFPDGYTESFTDCQHIPSVHHTVFNSTLTSE